MIKDYFKPVAVTDTPLHGDYACSNNCASVLRVKNLRVTKWPEVVRCKSPEAFMNETGIEHDDETYIRSYLHLFDSLEYDVEKVSWLNENGVCKEAFEHAKIAIDRPMTFDYDGSMDELFEKSTDAHFEFVLPNEIVFPVPIDLTATEFVAVEKYPAVYKDMLQTIAWRCLLTTLPVTDIKIVSNEPEDQNLLMLEQLMSQVNATVDDLMTELSTAPENIDYSKYDITIEFNGTRTCIGNGAKEYNGLQSYIEYMISEL